MHLPLPRKQTSPTTRQQTSLAAGISVLAFPLKHRLLGVPARAGFLLCGGGVAASLQGVSLAVLVVEVGGRFGAGMADFLRRLPPKRGRRREFRLRPGRRQRWTGMLLAVRALTLSRWLICWRILATCTQWLQAACRCVPEAAPAACQ